MPDEVFGTHRDNDEGRGSIFILDRQSLERRYKIDANPEVYWHSKTRFHDEAEEEIWDNVVDVGNHLLVDERNHPVVVSHHKQPIIGLCITSPIT
jgi:hypothetical protein